MGRHWISIALVAWWLAQAPRPQTVVIAGRVTDEFGDPVIDGRVSVELAGVTALRARSSGWSTTDDHGEYRIAALAPGDYIVAVDRREGYVVYSVSGPVTISSGRPQPETIYYPGTSVRADATPVTVAAGEERGQIDFVVRAEPPVLPPLAAMRIAQSGARPKDPDATAALRGRVSTIDGRVVPRAHVELVPEVDLTQSAVTVADADGTFEFRNLLPGRFRVIARKSGFAELEPNRGDAASPTSARTVELMRQETHERVDLALARWGSVSGTIVDEGGAPVRGAGLQLLQIRYSRGRRRLGGGGVARLTDDRGRYRMFAVPPGQYVVSAAVGGATTADLSGYARAYYPGTSNAANAQFVSVGRSQDLTGN